METNIKYRYQIEDKMGWKILAGIFVVGVFLTSGCVEKPPETTTTTLTLIPTTTTVESELPAVYCEINLDCVPAECCHPTSCINQKLAPDCTGVVCTMECIGPLDCGAGRCLCRKNECVVESSAIA